MSQIGSGRLAEEPNHFFVAGAVCQPRQADVIFSRFLPINSQALLSLIM